MFQDVELVTECRGRNNTSPVHQPDPNVAAGIAPEKIKRAVAIKIADPGDGPIQRHRTEIYGLSNLTTVHDPHPDIAARDVTQKYVAFHVGADNDPIRRQLPNDSRL